MNNEKEEIEKYLQHLKLLVSLTPEDLAAWGYYPGDMIEDEEQEFRLWVKSVLSTIDGLEELISGAVKK